MTQEQWEDESEKLIDELIQKLYWTEPYAFHNRLEIARALLKARQFPAVEED
jgi:hypothetical protein